MGVLFGKLQQGVIENQQILSIAQRRAKAEDNYGTELGEISKQLEQFKGGFARDDGATIKKVTKPFAWSVRSCTDVGSRHTMECERKMKRLRWLTKRSQTVSGSWW